MAGVLTVVAEEMGRAFEMVWSGVAVAIRLNNKLMTTVFRAATRIVQLLLLLVNKAADLLSLLMTDLLFFLSDIGNAVLTMGVAVHTGALTVVNFVYGTFMCIVSAVMYSCHLVHTLYCSILSWIVLAFGQLGNALNIVKHFFVLFGSSVIFLISLIPNLIYLTFTGLIHLCSCAYLACSQKVYNAWLTACYIGDTCISSIVNFLCDIPVEAVIGAAVGSAVLVGLKYVLVYMMDNLILIPDMPLPSLLIIMRQRFLRWYTAIVQRAHLVPPMEDDTEEEELDDTSDENGNDNNDNVPDLNLPQNQMFINQMQIPYPQVNVAGGLQNAQANRAGGSHNPPPPVAAPIIPDGLARRPLTRQRYRLQQEEEGEEEQEVAPIPEAAHAEVKRGGREAVANENGQAYQLYRELEQEREGRLCIVCQDQPKCVILLPCRHLCLCDACRSAIITRDNICPVCRRPIMQTLRVYV
ncbi:uncharacterized protein LOC119581126 [Penaeus monodon]|uniref:uncharacterized protein LOC119581126 n=1 Tax=Penaeus monodon TaxID=6687 RepID=UPI0018A74BE8|nr:uncharacterized protein LOC119581126 [Penaeus monodon]